MLVKWLSTKPVKFLQLNFTPQTFSFPKKSQKSQRFPPSFCANTHPCCPHGQASPLPPLPATGEAPFPIPPFFGNTPFGCAPLDGWASQHSVSEGLRPGLMSQAGQRWWHCHPVPFLMPHPGVPQAVHSACREVDVAGGTPGQCGTWMRLWSMEARARSL